MNINEVVKYPILSEKTYSQMAEGVYTFVVDKRTNKIEVKKTIEFIFEVKVAKIHIINVRRKPTKLGKFEGFKNSYKKAIIKLSEGQINIFPDEATSQIETKEKIKPKKEETIKKMSSIEEKAAKKIASKLKNKKIQNVEETSIKQIEKSSKAESIDQNKEVKQIEKLSKAESIDQNKEVKQIEKLSKAESIDQNKEVKQIEKSSKAESIDQNKKTKIKKTNKSS